MANQQLQNRIAEQRRAKGLSQQQLAERLGVHWITLSKLERGVTRLHLEWLAKISEALGIEEQDLLLKPRHIRNIQITSLVNYGGQIEFVPEDEVRYFSYNIGMIFDPTVTWIGVKGSALYPYFRHKDILAVRWLLDYEYCDEAGNINYSPFFGQLCVVEDVDKSQWMGILGPSSAPEAVNLTNANHPPVENVMPARLGRVTLAVMAPRDIWSDEAKKDDSV